jgi:hypothetical protein
MWNLDNDERPGVLIGYVGPRVKGGKPVRSATFSTEGPYTVRDRLFDPEKLLGAQLEEIDGRLAYRGDFVPALCPELGVVGIPSAFGCEVIWWENDLPAVRPAIGDDPEAVYDLPRPSVTDGVLGRILDYTRYFIERTQGRYPIRLADIQGPLDSAALIFGHNNFLTALYTHPKEVHYLLQMVTNLTIEFVQAQREIVHSRQAEFAPSLFQPWMPDGFGVSVSNDECVMISAAMHDEFHVPYLNQMSEAFGGVYVHCAAGHQFPAWRKSTSCAAWSSEPPKRLLNPCWSTLQAKSFWPAASVFTAISSFRAWPTLWSARCAPARPVAAFSSMWTSPTGWWTRPGRKPTSTRFTGWSGWPEISEWRPSGGRRSPAR